MTNNATGVASHHPALLAHPELGYAAAAPAGAAARANAPALLALAPAIAPALLETALLGAGLAAAPDRPMGPASCHTDQ